MNTITQFATNLVRAYMADGYSLYLGENARGSQSGEAFAIHLTNDNGKTVVKIYGMHRLDDDCNYRIDAVVERFKNGHSALWNGKGEILYIKRGEEE